MNKNPKLAIRKTNVPARPKTACGSNQRPVLRHALRQTPGAALRSAPPANQGASRPSLIFPSDITPQGDGSYVVRPGRPRNSKPLNVRAAALELGCCVQTVRNMIEDGRLAAFDIGTKKKPCPRIHLEDLLRFKAAAQAR